MHANIQFRICCFLHLLHKNMKIEILYMKSSLYLLCYMSDSG
jgi:hypothetical protein